MSGAPLRRSTRGKRVPDEPAPEAAAAAPVVDEQPGTPKKVRKTTARKPPKGKKGDEPPPEPAPAPAPAAATKADVIGLLQSQARLHLPPEVSDAAIEDALSGVLDAYPLQDYDALLVLEGDQEAIVGQVVTSLTPVPEEVGSAAAAAAAQAASPSEDALLAEARKLPTPALTPAPTPVPTPVQAPPPPPAPDSEADESPVPEGPGGFTPTPVPPPESSQASSMSASAASLESASSMGSVEEEVTVDRVRRISTLIPSEIEIVQTALKDVGEARVDFPALQAADTPANPIYLFELVRPADAAPIKALGLGVFYSITIGGQRYDHVRILALGVRTGEPTSSLTDLLRRFARFAGSTYAVRLPGREPILNPNIIVQYVRNQVPEKEEVRKELAVTLKELKTKFVYAPYNLQGQVTGLVVKGEPTPIPNWIALVVPKNGVAGTVAHRYTSYAPAATKTVTGDEVSAVRAFNSVSLAWEESKTLVLVSTTGILAEENPLTLPAGSDAYPWTLTREALTGTSAPMAPLHPPLPGRADDLIRVPRGGTRRRRTTSHRSS